MDTQWNRFFALLLRDGLVIAAVLALWSYVLRLGAAHDTWSIGIHILTGLLTVFVAYLMHEWGHLLGAWAARSAFELPGVVETFFLFRFDNVRNSRKQFFSMALGGFASSIVTVAFLLLVLPWSLLASQIALALTALGVLATLVIEVPEFWRVWRGGPLPTGAAFVSQPLTSAERIEH
ncbi:MAG: hypothetical protein JWR16_107 [Nevskia sp.]|nr:hypothetical protein [Nevskia sp.]